MPEPARDRLGVPRLAVYPALELRHGMPVARGADPQSATAQGQMRGFEEAGARWLSITDVDAALGERNQWALLSRLLGECRSKVQFGGGVRHMTQVQQLLDLGVERVVIGTQAIRNPLWIREVARIFPSRVVLAMDGRNGELLVEGRCEPAAQQATDLVASLDDAGLAGFWYTEVEGGGEAAPALVRQLRAAAKATPVLISCTSAGLEALDALAGLGIDGAVVGRNAHDGHLDLAEALERYPSPPAWPVAVLAAHEGDEGYP